MPFKKYPSRNEYWQYTKTYNTVLKTLELKGEKVDDEAEKIVAKKKVTISKKTSKNFNFLMSGIEDPNEENQFSMILEEGQINFGKIQF